MKVVHLTPGTGGYYCGVCLRDHELTIQLKAQGLDVTQVPLYLPLYTEHQETDNDVPIFFGAVNSWLQQKSVLFRATPRWLDSLLDKPGILKYAARRADTTTARNHGDMTVSMLRGEHGKQMKELRRLSDWLEAEVKPDLICVGTALLAGMLPYLKKRHGCKTLCTLQGEDTFIDSLPAPWSEQAWQAIRDVAPTIDAFVSPSGWYGDQMAPRLQVNRQRINVVYNGIELDEFTVAPPPEIPTIGFLAHLCPPKGLHRLVDAFIRLHQRPEFANLRLHVAGSMLETEAHYLREQEAKIAAANLQQHVRITPNVSRADKLRFFNGLTAFSVPVHYGEAFGLYLPEAWASGVPTVQPDSGAFPELHTLSGGGLVYDPESTAAFDDALAKVLLDPALRATLSASGKTATHAHFNAKTFSHRIADLYKAVLNS